MDVREETLDHKGFKCLYFNTTPKISTYLIAFAVGDFDFVEDKLSASGKNGKEVTVRIYAPSGKMEQVIQMAMQHYF